MSSSPASSRDVEPLEPPLALGSSPASSARPSSVLGEDSSSSFVSSSFVSSSFVSPSASSSSSSGATSSSMSRSTAGRCSSAPASSSAASSRLKRAARSSCALDCVSPSWPDTCRTWADVRTSSSSKSASLPNSSSSNRPSGTLAGSPLGLATGLSMSSHESRISGSLGCSLALAAPTAGAPGMPLPGASSISSEAFTVQTPSRSSTRYFGTHVPLAPSPQMAPLAVAHESHCCHSGSETRVLRLPMTMQPRLARVSITFRRRQSAKKPTLPSLLFRTAQKMMTSFSCPWKPSTDSTSSPERNFWRPGRSRMSFLMKLTWPL
mmetsp:Transcript_77027/g.225912  ORF Transcript_77027/g.225912 Transcript_77027/m.225912 type:complete len:322 (+) Transcript_77027:163-1128(+)